MFAANILLLLTVIVWGWSFVATKICLGYLSPIETIGLRLLIGAPILFLLIKLKKVKLNLNYRDKSQSLAALIITAHFIVQATGLKYTTATNTGWIIALIPLIVAVLAFLLLKEHIGYKLIAGIAIASFGVLLLISKGHPANFGWLRSGGDWLVLISAHTWAFYTIVTRDLSRSRDPLGLTFSIILPATILFLTIMLFTSDWTRIIHLPVKILAAIVFLGILATALAHWFWQLGVSKMGAARAGVFLYLEPVATTALAVPYLHESYGMLTAIGGFLVLFGVWFASRKQNKLAVE
jgi:drug/metabolite transporter (DMT)-like permease